MSGTSLDGVDIACCTFDNDENRWRYRIEYAETIPYSTQWKKLLAGVESGSALDLATTDTGYGQLLGRLTREFISKYSIQPDFIASHGHTIFHQPENQLTYQIGNGAAIAAETGLPVVCDFRSHDVALGGQGAPLVPIGDKLLFGDAGFCLNIGGFANISFDKDGSRIAYDVCPANIVLNHLAGLAGQEYDADGRMAAAGNVITPLLETLNNLPYYGIAFPKSLGKEWVIAQIHPLLEGSGYHVNDLLATFCEHIAIQVAKAAKSGKDTKLFITGGGAFNGYLTGRIRHHAVPDVVIPDPLTVNFKEALIFAFLGVLRMRNEVNSLRSVTGAIKDSSGGAIY